MGTKKTQKIKKPIFGKIMLVLVLLGLIYCGLYVYSLSKTVIERVEINSLEDVSLSGFVLGGDIYVINYGIIPVEIQGITYQVKLDSNNHELARGNIGGKKINPRQSTPYKFSNKINWIPTAEVAYSLVNSEKITATIYGTLHVANLKFVKFEIPFTKKINLEAYIKQFVRNKVEEAISTVKETANNIADTIGDGVKKIGDAIGGLFS